MKRPAKAKAKGKRKTKVGKPKQTRAKTAERVTPIRLGDGQSLRMKLHDVIKIAKMVEKHGRLNKFTRKLKDAESEVLVPAATVNLVKDFVADNGLHQSAMGKHIVFGAGRPAAATDSATTASFTADDGDPNQCQFGKAEPG